MSTSTPWQFLVRKPKSNYRQLFVKDRWIAAQTLYGETMGEGARTAAQVAEDYGLPLEVVLEAIAYCESNPPEILEDYARDETLMEATGMNDPNYKYNPTPKIISPQERARILRS